MCTDRDPPPCEHGELIALVSRQQDQVARLTATIKELRKELAEAKRAGKRQAAPFSKGGRTNKPKRPGRKPGIGSSATASRRLQMRSPSRQWMCRWPTTTVPDVEECSSRREWMLST